MKSALVIIFIVLFKTMCFSQNFGSPKVFLVDSLILEQISTKDSLTLREALDNYNNVTPLGKKLEALTHITDECWDNAIWPKYNDLIISKAERSNNFEKDTTTHNALANAYQNKGYFYSDVETNIDSSIHYYQKASDAFGILKKENEKATALSSLGLEYFKNSEIIAAVKNYNKALKIYEKENNIEGLAYVYNYLSGLHDLYNNREKAIAYSNLSFQYAEKIDLYEMMVNSLGVQSNLLRKEKKYTESLALSLKALAISKKTENKFYQTNQLRSISSDFVSLNKYDSAEYYASKALVMSQHHHIKIQEVGSLNILAQISLHNNKIDQGINYAKSSIEIAEGFESLKEAHHILYLLYDKKGDDTNTLFHYKKHNEYKDGIFTNSKEKSALVQSIQYEFDKQKEINEIKNAQKIELEKEKSKRSKYLSYSVLLFALIVVGFLLFIFKKLKIISKQKIELDNAYLQLKQRKKNELAASNLKALNSQMNPHFMFNALNSVQDLILQQDTKKSNIYLGKFAELLRKTLEYSQVDTISLQKELDTTLVYLELEKLRFGNTFSYSIENSLTEEDTQDIQVPSLLLQPYVENAIKHGLLHKKGMRILVISATKENRGILITIEDNGVGRQKSEEINKRRANKPKSFAMDANANRLMLIEEGTGRRVKISIEDKEDPTGTVVRLKMSLS